jgi:hypothetical protein
MLETSDIIVFLVSSDFLSSYYCYEKELRKGLELKEAGRVRLIAIKIREVDLTGSPFEQFIMLPTDAKPVDMWNNRDEAWYDVAKGIRRICEEILKEKDTKIYKKEEEIVEQERRIDKTEKEHVIATIAFGKKGELSRLGPQDKPT